MVRPFSKFWDTCSSYPLRLKTSVEDSSTCSSTICASLTKLLSIGGAVFVRDGAFSSQFSIAVACFSVSWVSVWQILELMRNDTSPLPVWGVFRNCSVALPKFCGWIPFGGMLTFEILSQIAAFFRVFESLE